MYLSDRDLNHAIETGRLIVEPKPNKIDSTSIDVHLDSIEKAMVWDIEKFSQENTEAGRTPSVSGPARSNTSRSPENTSRRCLQPRTRRFTEMVIR
jgi:deoxycytidine triphosphate deaminase